MIDDKPVDKPIEEPHPCAPDYSRQGIFVYHNCWRCDDGKKPCVQGLPSQCEFPHARDD